MHPLLDLKRSLEESSGTKARVHLEDPWDISVPVGFFLARKNGGNPERNAMEFVESFEHPLVERADVVNGYANFYIKRDAFLKALFEDPLGVRKASGTVVIDFSSPNVARPMHVGHLRSTLIGGSLKKVHEFVGYNVVGINYLGDFGLQYGKLIVAYRRWVNEKSLKEDPVRELLRLYVLFHKEVEKNPDLEEEARKAFSELEKGVDIDLWKKFREWSIHEFEKTYRVLGVEFDEYSGESFYVERAKNLVEVLLEKGVLERDETGAVRYGNTVVLKSDGSTLYITRDLAALVDRVERYSPKKLVYVVGAEQKEHFKALFSLAREIGVRCELVHVPFAHVILPEGRMSTRSGRVVFAKDVLQRAVELAAREMENRGENSEEISRKVGIGAVKYAILRIEPEKTVEFSWERILAFRGETGPYCQYACVRARRILEKGGSFSGELLIPTDAEWKLIKHIAMFPLVVEDVIKKYSPHYLARYSFSLADALHSFYEKNPVLHSGRKDFRLLILRKYLEVLEKTLELLLISVPDRM